MRAEYLVHRLLYEPVDHVGNAKTSLPTTRLGDPHTADHPWLVVPRTQRVAQHRQDVVEVLAHFVDTLPIRTRCASIRRHMLKRRSQVLLRTHSLDRHRG
jgi:hypothetical protein